MRVCMIVRNACVRDARVLREAGTLAAAGHDVTIVATYEAGVAREEERDGFKIVRVDPVPSWVRRIVRRPLIPQSAEPALVQPALKRRPPLLVVLRDVLVTKQLTAATCAIPADVYHAHDANTLAAGVAAARKHNARLVYDAHELYDELTGLSTLERTRWRALESKLVGRADHVVTVSESLANELVRRYGIARPLVLINSPERSATPPDPQRSALQTFRKDGRLLVLYSGGISANRGLEALVDAAQNANGWDLVMMGWGRLHDELKARAPSVAFADPVAPEDLVATAAGADVGVIPYVPVGMNNALSLPNKLFEYVHAGLAVVASDLVELRRFVNETSAGVVFPPGDAVALAALLDALAADPARVRAMRAAADEASRAHDWARERTKLVALYEAIAPR